MLRDRESTANAWSSHKGDQPFIDRAEVEAAKSRRTQMGTESIFQKAAACILSAREWIL